MLQIHLIALDDILWVLGPPPGHHPADSIHTCHNVQKAVCLKYFILVSVKMLSVKVKFFL
jgi:hypothetical protein